MNGKTYIPIFFSSKFVIMKILLSPVQFSPKRTLALPFKADIESKNESSQRNQTGFLCNFCFLSIIYDCILRL